MDFVQEAVFLGVDVLLLGLCLKEYYYFKKISKSLKNAPQLTIDESLRDKLKQSDGKIRYGVIRGTVTPIGTPLKSVMTPSVTGVLQVMKLNEHRVARGFAGFWAEQRKLIHISFNEVPFCLTNGKLGVEVVDGLSAEILDMDTVYDNYEPSSLSLFDHIFGFFSGVRQKGMQTTEEILRNGSFITAVGELELDGNSIRLQPSPVAPMFLTTATKSTLLKKFEEAKNSMLFKVIVCGTISAVLVGLITRKIYKRKKMEWDEQALRDKLEKSRAQRRALARQQVFSDDQRCVVCVDNPKEVICLPCGHVCLCENCAVKIKLNCPVCRSKIESKAAAFIT
ncbi:mitochondrial E3 ubiquitin protein ligase 1 [Toxorhynchites rutilus septentrionalis]|uniref:mitochondrial E3 ubiquitin protein ligase 1 n=1 Tax=Toxorhynchites rutilus septentrionalis TaxID=329112 RepID=UPI00247A16C8|nr:mitochondrial E3 ubiquitin protein ligase 1 [Toxorhynchites rutilus septentrionalis]XP_055619045.1 mitochondrial E3 ubiquitin protein ligase 1 [Toxorhynchites rutilus septentrionalis]